MKKFREFITEAPFNDEDAEWGQETTKLSPKTNRLGDKVIDYQEVFEKFDDKYTAIGEGSSRIAFKADINKNVFKTADLESLKVVRGKVPTVFKLAMNRKGVVQNRLELKIWSEVRGTKYARFLAPIVDWSGNPAYNNNKYYTINDELKSKNGIRTAPFWLQMGKVTIYDWGSGKFSNICKKYFGLASMPDGYSKAEISRMLKAGKLTEEQAINCNDFITLCKKYKIEDLHSDNIGMYNNIPVILDYGYNDETQEMYWGSKGDVKVNLNKAGEIEIHWD